MTASVKLVALLDPPAPRSMGLTAIAVVGEDRKVRILGMAKASEHRYGADPEEAPATPWIDLMVAGGHAVILPPMSNGHPFDESTVALWVGDDFLRLSEALWMAPEVPADGADAYLSGLRRTCTRTWSAGSIAPSMSTYASSTRTRR